MKEPIIFMEDEKELEKIRSLANKKPKLSLLNQKKLSKWELDELFLEEEEEDIYDLEEM